MKLKNRRPTLPRDGPFLQKSSCSFETQLILFSLLREGSSVPHTYCITEKCSGAAVGAQLQSSSARQRCSFVPHCPGCGLQTDSPSSRDSHKDTDTFANVCTHAHVYTGSQKSILPTATRFTTFFLSKKLWGEGKHPHMALGYSLNVGPGIGVTQLSMPEPIYAGWILSFDTNESH